MTKLRKDMDPISHIDANMKGLITDLQILIRQPSVSAQNQGIEKCAKLVQKLLQKSGIKSEMLRLKKRSSTSGLW